MPKRSIIAVITGDISGSASRPVKDWLPTLKKVLKMYGAEVSDWEVFRGDSFQLHLAAEEALSAALHLKAALLQKRMNLRLSVGVGFQSHKAKRITECNGSAYQYSGWSFEQLRKNQLRFHSSDEQWSTQMNVTAALAMLTINDWTQVVAGVVKAALESPDKTQNELADALQKSQSNISTALRRGGFEELMKWENWYRKSITTSNFN